MTEPRELVEHFFRHEFGRLVAVLTRSLGVRRLELAEDVVQAALMQALQTWPQRGVPEDAAGWLYRTARNLAIDALRREQTSAQALPRLVAGAERESSPPRLNPARIRFHGQRQSAAAAGGDRLDFPAGSAVHLLAAEHPIAPGIRRPFGVRRQLRPMLEHRAGQ